jgi:tRNA pseudouridine38-40 synthase
LQNLKLGLEYDGTRYSGWQIQKNARTVGGAFAEALSGVLKESPQVFAAGRTDAGVHAMAQVLSFRTRTSLSPRELKEQLNDRLPADINVLDVMPAPMSFHARHAAASRTYRYQVSRRRTAFGKRFVWWVRSPLDLAILEECAAVVGRTEDFRSFAEGDVDEEGEAEAGRSSRVRVKESAWTVEDHLLVYRIRANRFLWKMVRRLVGTMVASAIGQIDRGSMPLWLREPTREPARLTAPPSGLFLETVEYAPGGDVRPAPGAGARGGQAFRGRGRPTHGRR